jgi:hypothetical protein
MAQGKADRNEIALFEKDGVRPCVKSGVDRTTAGLKNASNFLSNPQDTAIRDSVKRDVFLAR